MASTSATSPATPALEDVQGKRDTRGIALTHAGVSEVEMPLTILQKNGKTQRVAANARMSVGLDAEEKGTHMSRFIIQLKEWSEDKVFSVHLREFLQEMQQRLNAPSACVDVAFKYFIGKKAPVTDDSAPMAYTVSYQGLLKGEELDLTLKLAVPMATLCPCSKAISDFGAHNQRAITTLTLKLDTEVTDGHPVVWIEDLVQLVDDEASCPVFPLLKRDDEKWVTERQYTNAKFVEDVCRDVALRLREQQGIAGFSVTVEALESIHGHNAWAAYEENLLAPAVTA